MLPARLPHVTRASGLPGSRLPIATYLCSALAAVALGGYGCATLFGMDDASCIDCTSTRIDPNLPAANTADPSAVPAPGAGSSGRDASSAGPEPARPAPGPSAPSLPGAPPDAGADSGTAPVAPIVPEADACVRYCDQITTTCLQGSGELPDHRAYLDRDACLKVCPHFPTGSASGNTLECRLGLLESPEAVERSAVCQAAGRSGQAGADAVCGSSCDAYCSLMHSICPTEFALLAPSCASVCAGLDDRLAFDVVRDETAGNSVQCRLWHVAVAATCDPARDAGCLLRHCGHSAGNNPCNPPAP